MSRCVYMAAEKYPELVATLKERYNLVEVSVCETTNSVWGVERNKGHRGYRLGDLSYLLHSYVKA